MLQHMKVNEIFDSIDGEGLRTGELATFIRFAGCNIRCVYCDTDYALCSTDGVEMGIAAILERVKECGNKNITITGGEPLLQPHIFDLLGFMHDYSINIETNGTLDIERLTAFKNVIVTMDYKTKSSNMNHAMNMDNIPKLRNTDCLKIVMSKQDEDEVENFLSGYDIKPIVCISPIFGEYEPKDMADFLKRLRDKGIKTERIRMQLQLHKIIWNPEERGV